MKKYILVFSAVLLFMPPLVRAQVILPNAGLTPESPFYFLDRFSEALQEFFTFNPEAKAHLQITFAAERVAEIKVILETKGVNAKGLEVAQSRMNEHLANAATIVTEQKADGKDVSGLAKELDNEFEAPKTALEQTFKDEKKALEAKEKELKAKIREARRLGDTVQVEALTKELIEVKAQKELLEQSENEQGEDLDEQEEILDEQMETKDEAAKKIKEAGKEKAEMMLEAQKDGLDIPAETFAQFDSLLSQAKAAFDSGKYEEAKQLAKQAEKSLDAAEKVIENLKEEKDNEEEFKADQEKQGQEVKQEQNKSKEETEKTEE